MLLTLQPTVFLALLVIAVAVALQAVLALGFVIKSVWPKPQPMQGSILNPSPGIYFVDPDSPLMDHRYEVLTEALTKDGGWDEVDQYRASRRADFDAVHGERIALDMLLSGTYSKFRIRFAKDGRIESYTYMWLLADGNIKRHVLNSCWGYE